MRFLLFFVAVSCSSSLTTNTASQTGQSKWDRQVGEVRLRGTPEIPEELKRDLARYTSGRSASALSMAANGHLLVRTRFGDTSQVHLVKQPLGARQQVTFLPEPVSSASFVPGNSNAMVYLADVGGNEKYQLFRRDLKTGVTQQLTDGKSRNGAPLWSKDGKKMVYNSNGRNGKSFDLWVSHGVAGDSKLLLETDGWWYAHDWSSDGTHLLVGKYVSINESHVYLLEVATGKLKRLSPEGQTANPEARFGASDDEVLIVSDKDGEFQKLYLLNLNDGKWKNLTEGLNWNVGSLEVASDNKRAVFTTNENGYGKLYELQLPKYSYQAIAAPDTLVGGLGFAPGASNKLMMTLSGPTSNGDAFVYSFTEKKFSRYTESELGDVARSSLVKPTLIEYTTFDGKKISAFYYKASGEGPRPVVVSIHGGPEGQSRPWYSARTQYLLNQGISVLLPNVRGSTGYGKTFVKLDNGFKREDSVKDIGALLDWIDSAPDLDAKKVAVIGGSYGGYMVMASLMHYSARIVAGVEVVGISNFVTFLENTADYRRDLRRAEYGDERDPKMREFQQKISPLNHVEKIKSALFVAQGANDPRVPASEAEQIVNAAEKNGKDVWYYLAMDEGHGFKKKPNRDLYNQLAVMFLTKHLLGP